MGMMWIDGFDRWPVPSAPKKRKYFFTEHALGNSIINRLFYRGGIYVTALRDFGDPDEILMWIKENLATEVIVKINSSDHWLLKFKTKEALMAYKLRWV